MPKITATTPYGQFSRKTERTYTHVILVCGFSESFLRQRNAENIKWRERNVREYSQVIASGVVPSRFASSCTLDDYKKYLAEAEADLADLPAQLERQLAESRAKIEAKDFKALSWAGRPDLAEKAAATARKTYGAVEVYPVD